MHWLRVTHRRSTTGWIRQSDPATPATGWARPLHHACYVSGIHHHHLVVVSVHPLRSRYAGIWWRDRRRRIDHCLCGVIIFNWSRPKAERSTERIADPGWRLNIQLTGFIKKAEKRKFHFGGKILITFQTRTFWHSLTHRRIVQGEPNSKLV